MDEARWVCVAETSEVAVGRALAVEVEGRWLAVCNDGGRFHVVDNRCPHEGGTLARGEVVDGCVVCPVHGWPFDLTTGLTDPRMPSMRLQMFRCEVRDGKVYADLSGPLPPPMPSWPGESD